MQALTEDLEPQQIELSELVCLAQSGDRQAFGELVTRYEAAVFSTALRRLGNYAEAQELCQEVFVKALEKIDQLQTPAAFGGWLRSITVRMAINRQVRRVPTTAAEPEAFEAACANEETPLDQALAREQRQQIRAGLRRLGELDRETLTAFYFRGQTLLEMSETFDSPVGTIKRRLHVARKRLADELAELAV